MASLGRLPNRKEKVNEDGKQRLAQQFREHIQYAGDAAQFDQEVSDLIRVVEDHCAWVVEQTPVQLFMVTAPRGLLGIIAAEIRGEI